MAQRKPRPLSTVVLPDGVGEGILADMQRFLCSEEWYANRGIPYRRGYLLHGPPGTGKSSLCLALAGALKMDVCLISLSDPSLDDEGLRTSLTNAPAGSLLLFEDVDSIFVGRDKVSADQGGGGWDVSDAMGGSK